MKREKITSIIYKNSTDNSEGLMIKFENIANVINLLCEADMPEEPKDYEILSFRVIGNNNIWQINEDKRYAFAGMDISNQLQFMLKCLKEGRCKIYSVRRLSDGEVFAVGETQSQSGNIKKFTIDENGILVHHFNGDVLYLDLIRKAVEPAVLLTTEDNVEVTDLNTMLFICYKDFNVGICSVQNVSKNQNNKYFSTAAARDGYIFYNKPITTTCKEIENVLDGNIEDCYLEKVKAFFKSKQS